MSENQNIDGTPAARFDGLMSELEKRFPNPRPFDSSIIPELVYLDAIDKEISDLRQRVKDLEYLYDVAHGANSPENHFNYFMQKLEKRLPAIKSHVRNKAKVDLVLQEFDRLVKDSIELQYAKRKIFTVLTDGLFTGEEK